MKRVAIALAAVLVLVVACATGPESLGQPTSGGPEAIATNLDVPWGIAFLPDGSALIAERDSGAVQHMAQPGVVSNVGAVAGVAARGEGGLLGLATAGQTVFAYLTSAQDNRVVTMRFDGASLTGPSPILTGIPARSIHDGGRIAFGPDGKLYVTTGESGDPGLAQDRSSLGGKILRINPDGSIPPDNPDPASPVWSFGHRNIQGLAWDSAGRLWVTEYGANRLDELNLIQRGGNYGWPMAEGRADTPGLIDPVIQWSVGQASPSGLAYLAARCGWHAFVVSGSTGYRSAPTAHWPIRHRCSSDSTGDCAPSPPHRTARCGSPPATATVGAAPVTATTGFCSSGPEPAVSLCPALDDIGGGCGCVPKTDQ
jgi:glucose/arabinose dehydrogenase